MTVSAVLSLLNLASVGVFGIVLSAAFCDLEWTRQRKGILAVSTVLMLALQAVVSLHWGTGLARYLYPVITHLPLFLLLAVLTGKWLWPLVAVLTAYLCCQLRRWANQAAVEFMPFVCSLAYLFFVLQTNRQQMLRSQLEQTQNSLNLQVAQAVREIDALRESQRKASTYRHDLRHHLQYISSCIENGRTDTAQDYIRSVCREIEASKVTVYCENEAANLILSAFAARAAGCGVDFRVRSALPQTLPLPESDLCVLLSNALENALHACQRQNAAGLPAFIETSAYEQDGRFFLQLANACSTPVLFEDGVPVTREPGHGLGVRSICAIVEKYGGIYSFTQKQEQFILRISI